MANIMNMLQIKNKPSRDGYDLSKKIVFSAKSGELDPTYCKLLMTGDKVNIDTKWLTNTRPVNTDAYTRIREYFNWYFVPLHLLWDKSFTWFADLKDNTQVATSINGGTQLADKHPYFTTYQVHDLLTSLENLTESENKLNLFGFERAELAKKLLSYLGYGDFYKDKSSVMKNVELSPWRLLAYQKIYQDYYRNDQWEAARPETYNLNYIDGSEDSLNIPLSEMDITRYTMFDMRYTNWNKDYFMGLLPNSQFGDAASVDLSVLENPSSSALTPFEYTLDYLANSDVTGSFSVGKQSNTSGELVAYNGSSYFPDYPLKFQFDENRLQQLRSALGLSTNANVSSAFTVLALRQAEALQKYKEIKQANKYDIPSQIQAQYGVRPNNAYSQRCTWIGGIDGNIDINPVVNTNITDANSAQVAGRGTSAGSGHISFETDVPGVLMCIYHCVPLLDYAITGVSPDNTKTYFTDYAQPIFDKTGMQQVDMVHLINNWVDYPLGFTDETLLGYGPIYLDYKTDIDEVRGAFVHGKLGSWVAPVNQAYIEKWLNGNQSGDYAVWNGLNATFFKVNPATLDPIFSGEVSDSSVATDQFWVNSYFQVSAVRNLDRDGLPY